MVAMRVLPLVLLDMEYGGYVTRCEKKSKDSFKRFNISDACRLIGDPRSSVVGVRWFRVVLLLCFHLPMLNCRISRIALYNHDARLTDTAFSITIRRPLARTTFC